MSESDFTIELGTSSLNNGNLATKSNLDAGGTHAPAMRNTELEITMKTKLTSRFWIAVCAAFALVSLIGITSGVGAYVGNRLAQEQVIPAIPQLELNAGTASRSKSMSMATGLVDGNVEGLFLLDHVSGVLQCWVLSPKTGSVGGYYTANVGNDLAVAGKTGSAEYMMVTGNFFFDGNTGNLAPGQSVCYVGDASTGNVVGYGLVWQIS